MVLEDYFDITTLDVYEFSGGDRSIITSQLAAGQSYYIQDIEGKTYVAVTKDITLTDATLVKL